MSYAKSNNSEIKNAYQKKVLTFKPVFGNDKHIRACKFIHKISENVMSESESTRLKEQVINLI